MPPSLPTSASQAASPARPAAAAPHPSSLENLRNPRPNSSHAEAPTNIHAERLSSPSLASQRHQPQRSWNHVAAPHASPRFSSALECAHTMVDRCPPAA